MAFETDSNPLLHNALLLLGGNLGDMPATLAEARQAIQKQCGEVVAASSLFVTPPWGFESAHNFHNQALSILTPLAPLDLLHQTQAIEHALGRRRNPSDTGETRHYSDRPIDIDIIFYDNIVHHSPTLDIPHPKAHLRRFVLAPLCHIAPHYLHPLLHQTVEQLLATCPDNSPVEEKK